MPEKEKDKEKDKKSEKDITKQARENIPLEVWEQLPDSIKKEIDPNYQPPPPKSIFQGASPDLTESINRLRDGFEKIGLTLIGRMGEFATTLERVMMIVARMDKVENLVSEVKYILKGLQKTLENVNVTIGKFDSMNLSLELEGIKKILQTSGASLTTTPVKPTPIKIETSEKIKPNISETIEVKPNSKSIEPEKLEQQERKGISPFEQILKEKVEPVAKVQNLFACFKTMIAITMTCDELGNNLEFIRDAISQCYRWVPTLYDIGKVARKYKMKNGTKLSLDDVNEVQKYLVSWEEKILK